MLRLTRTVPAVLILATAILSACGGGAGTGNGTGSSLLPSCDDLSSIESYRYSLNLGLDTPAFDGDVGRSSTDPLNTFSDALTALFSDIELEGAYVAPDRTQVVLTFEGEELEWRSIGERNWVRFEDEWEEQPPGDDDILTPQIVCDDIVEDLTVSFDGVGAEEETVNGVETYHYALGREDIERLPDILGGAGTDDVPEEIEFDIWLAQDGLWLMKIAVEATDADEDGQPVRLSLGMELRDVNDDGIAIEPPGAGE